MTGTAAGTACIWDVASGLMPSASCPEPPVCTITEACEHEHVNAARACAAHAEFVLLEENWVCGECAMGPRPHDCPATNVITWDGPAVASLDAEAKEAS